MVEKEKDNTIVIGFAGDVMIGRSVNDKIAETTYDYPSGNVLPVLRSTDVNIINLETTLTTGTYKVYLKLSTLKQDRSMLKFCQKQGLTW